MQYMDFTQIIEQHSTEFTLIYTTESGYNSKGDYVKGEEVRETLYGAILSHRLNKVYRSEGTLTQQDRVLYMLSPLTCALKSAKVIHEGNLYSIDSVLDNSKFTGIWSYNLKYCSAFKDGDVIG